MTTLLRGDVTQLDQEWQVSSEIETAQRIAIAECEKISDELKAALAWPACECEAIGLVRKCGQCDG